MAGRKPKPSALRRAEGNPGHRPIPDEPKLPVAQDLTPFFELGDDAQKFFDRFAPVLAENEILTVGDMAQFTQLAYWWGLFVQAQRLVTQEGPITTYVNKVGAENLSPTANFRIAKSAAEMVNKLSPDFGMTPSARVRLGTVKTDDGISEEDAAAFGDC